MQDIQKNNGVHAPAQSDGDAPAMQRVRLQGPIDNFFDFVLHVHDATVC